MTTVVHEGALLRHSYLSRKTKANINITDDFTRWWSTVCHAIHIMIKRASMDEQSESNAIVDETLRTIPWSKAKPHPHDEWVPSFPHTMGTRAHTGGLMEDEIALWNRIVSCFTKCRVITSYWNAIYVMKFLCRSLFSIFLIQKWQKLLNKNKLKSNCSLQMGTIRRPFKLFIYQFLFVRNINLGLMWN